MISLFITTVMYLGNGGYVLKVTEVQNIQNMAQCQQYAREANRLAWSELRVNTQCIEAA